MKLWIAGLLVVATLSGSWGCGATVKHYAVTADFAFATAVGVFDDTIFDACQQAIIDAARCNTIKPIMIDLLKSVKATSEALRAMPDDGALPKSLPDMVLALEHVRKALGTFGDMSNPTVARVASQFGSAMEEALKLLYIFVPVTR